MYHDSAGLEITSQSAEAVAAYDRSVASLLEYRLDAGQHAKSALKAQPDFPMGLCFRGYALMQLGTNQVHGKVDQTLQQAKSVSAVTTCREQHHISALEYWMNGHVRAACREWEQILVTSPADLLALRLHHFMSFWQGHRSRLRDVPAAVVGAIDESTPGYGFAVGMFAFGLEECGDYVRAEEFGRRAVSVNGDDLWAVHVVAHVLEMQSRHREGTQWLDQDLGVWQDRNPFRGHIWWHTALFSLELGDFERVLELYDRQICVDEGGFYLDLQNAASLLMRLQLLNIDVGERWTEVADLAETRIDDHHLPFTDIHFMLALTGARRLPAARKFVRSLEAFAETGGNDAAQITAAIGLPLARGLLAFAEECYGAVVDCLLELRHDMAGLGGSHAQQDIFTLLLIEAAIRDGRKTLARSLLAERCELRPGNEAARRQFALTS